MRKIKKILFSILVINLVSCASIINRHTQEIEISTSPPDAFIYADGWIAKTPVKLTLRSSAKSVLVKKDGYKDMNVAISKKTRYGQVFVGNIFWLVLYPFMVYVDYNNGTAFELEDMKITLEKDLNDKM